MRPDLSRSVVVITGASSGIGRATALKFADKGATVVLIARRDAALEEVAHQCRQRGGHALAMPGDVTDAERMLAIARHAVDTFGHIDIWIHNAAVCVFGRIDEIPIEAIRRAVDINVMGYIHGTRAALSHMRKRGSGMLIYVDSIVTSTPQPYTGPYTLSQAAIRSLADTVRMELKLKGAPDIDVCSVMPASVDTPLFHQAANYTGRVIQHLAPVYSPWHVADEIVALTQKPKRTLYIGRTARLMAAVHVLMPGIYERLISRYIDKKMFQDKPEQHTDGNLYRPLPQYASVTGGWSERNRSMIRAFTWTGIALATPLALWSLFGRRKHSAHALQLQAHNSTDKKWPA